MSISDAAKEHSDLALSVLVDVARNGLLEAARVSAANALLDRAYGRPIQGMEMTGKDGAALAPTVIILPANSRDTA